MIFAWFSPFVVVPMAARLKELKGLKRLKGVEEVERVKLRGGVAGLSSNAQCPTMFNGNNDNGNGNGRESRGEYRKFVLAFLYDLWKNCNSERRNRYRNPSR